MDKRFNNYCRWWRTFGLVMSIEKKILSLLPQQPPFRFVDEIISVDEETIVGKYTFRKDEFFYEGHFKGNHVTPGVILIECMAQIALACHSTLFLLKNDPEVRNKYTQFFSESNVQFLKPVYPGETVTVSGKKAYFRHGKMKSIVKMTDEFNKLISKAELSGLVFIDK